MRRFFVVTPLVAYVDLISPDIGGPIVEEAEVIEIEAETGRDAVKIGVRAMLADHSYRYCKEQRSDDLCPYTGVWAEEETP